MDKVYPLRLRKLKRASFKLTLFSFRAELKSFENTVGKEEIAHNEQFLLFPQCFKPFGELSAIFIRFEIVICKLFAFGRV